MKERRRRLGRNGEVEGGTCAGMCSNKVTQVDGLAVKDAGQKQSSHISGVTNPYSHEYTCDIFHYIIISFLFINVISYKLL